MLAKEQASSKYWSATESSKSRETAIPVTKPVILALSWRIFSKDSSSSNFMFKLYLIFWKASAQSSLWMSYWPSFRVPAFWRINLIASMKCSRCSRQLTSTTNLCMSWAIITIPWSVGYTLLASMYKPCKRTKPPGGTTVFAVFLSAGFASPKFTAKICRSNVLMEFSTSVNVPGRTDICQTGN